jgi:peptidoglycan-N-acetylglucosamine deacetylase
LKRFLRLSRPTEQKLHATEGIEQAPMPRVVVTTSWDDDDRCGLKVGELLSSHSLRATFYVPTGKLGNDASLSAGDIRNLSTAGFEIGGHTVSHAILTDIGREQLVKEVNECKSELQQILSAEVAMFCYPKGRFNSEVMSAVKRAGYRGARTTQMLAYSGTFSPFAIPVTVQAYPHQRTNYLRSMLRNGAVGPMLKSIPDLVSFQNWISLAQHMFDRVLRNGGVWHLYGHPWEIERLNLWNDLKEIFQYVSQKPGVLYLTNGELVQLLTTNGNGGYATAAEISGD